MPKIHDASSVPLKYVLTLLALIFSGVLYWIDGRISKMEIYTDLKERIAVLEALQKAKPDANTPMVSVPLLRPAAGKQR